jgi:6-phosphogluconolactonase (cycloisomerase 2 family)
MNRFVCRSTPIALLVAIAMAAPAAISGPAAGLIYLQPTAGTTPSAVAVSPDGRHVYDGRATYARNEATGELTPLDYQVLWDSFGDAAVSPDGAHVYVTSSYDELRSFERDVATGTLEPLETLTKNAGGLAELDGPTSIALSGDGAFVYVVCSGSQRILVFPRDAATGALGAPVSVDAPGSPRAIVLSPDGAEAYVVSSDDESVRVFARDASTGDLSLLQTLTNGVDDVTGLGGANDVEVTPDGRNVYVAASLDGIAIFARAEDSGLLLFAGRSFLYVAESLQLAASDDVVWVSRTAIDHRGDSYGSLSAWSRDADTGALASLDSVGLGIGSSDMAFAPGGRDVYLAGEEMLRAALVPETSLVAPIQTLQDGENGVAGLTYAHAPLVTPDGRHVLVLSTGIAIFARDTLTGQLSPVGLETELLFSPRAIVASPDARFLYVADWVGGIVRFARDPESGALDAIDATTDGLDGGAEAVVLSADGAWLYAAWRDAPGIARYARDAETGSIVHVDTIPLLGVEDMVLSPDGRFLYATRTWTYSELFVLARDPDDGSLAAPGEALGFFPASIGLAPDGSYLYWLATSCFNPYGCPHSISAYALDAATGRLDGLVFEDTTAPMLASSYNHQALEIAVSPDGRFLYLAGYGGLVAFTRDAASGAITYADVELAGTTGLTLSPAGSNLYAVNERSGTLRVYAPESGAALCGAAGALALAALRILRRPG